MRLFKKIGSGLLSLVTLFVYSVSNGFPKNRLANSIKSKIEDTLHQDDNNDPEKLILQKSALSRGENFAIDSSYASHRSHRSHASHRSSSSGSAAPRVRTAAPSPSTSKPKRISPLPLAALATVSNADVNCLGVMDLEKISGISGIMMQQEPTALHFLHSSGQEMLQVRFESPEYINVFRGSSFSSVQGVGESAIMGVLPIPSFLVFKKGEHCIEITTYQEEGSKLFLSIGQLISIAQVITSHL